VDVPDKVLEKRHLAEVRAKRKSKAFLLQGFLGIKSKSKTARRSGRRRTARMLGLGLLVHDRVVKVSFGRVECREFARTVGDNEVVGPIPLSLDWEVLSVMVASVDQYEDFRAPVREPKGGLSYPLLKNGLLEKCGGTFL
jgi:hypothetical protein